MCAFTASPAVTDVLFKAFEGARDLHKKAGVEYSAEFNSKYKQFAVDVMSAATKREEKELNLSQTVRHLLVFDVAGDGKCQLRALEVSQRPIFPTDSREPFCQLNTNQLFGMEETSEGQKFVTLEQENSIIRDRFRWVNEQYMPGQPHFEAILTALVSEMLDLSVSFIDNLKQTIVDLESRKLTEPGKKQDLELRIGAIQKQIEQKENEDAFLYLKQDPRWFIANREKLNTGLEKILGNECGNFWLSLYKEALQFPIITFVKKGSGENHFIEFLNYLGAPKEPKDLQLACAVKVSGHWKAVMPLNDEQFASLNERGLIQPETQVFHARDGEFNRWYLDGNLTGKTFHNETPPIGLTSELKGLCDSAPKGDHSRIEGYLRNQLKQSFKGFHLIQDEGTWVLMVTARQGEFCLTPQSPIVNQAPVQQPAARPAVAGGGAASSLVRPVAPRVAQPLAELDVTDKRLIKSLNEHDTNSKALEDYLKEKVIDYNFCVVDKHHDGWEIQIYTNKENKIKVKNPTVPSSFKAAEVLKKPAVAGGGAASSLVRPAAPRVAQSFSKLDSQPKAAEEPKKSAEKKDGNCVVM
jgi:hypothetical protein